MLVLTTSLHQLYTLAYRSCLCGDIRYSCVDCSGHARINFYRGYTLSRVSLAEFRRGRLLLGPISNIFRASRAKTKGGKNGSRSWPLADSSILKAPIHTRLAIKLHREIRVCFAASFGLAYDHQKPRTLECKCVLNITSGFNIELRWYIIMLSTQHRSSVPCSYLHGI